MGQNGGGRDIDAELISCRFHSFPSKVAGALVLSTTNTVVLRRMYYVNMLYSDEGTISDRPDSTPPPTSRMNHGRHEWKE